MGLLFIEMESRVKLNGHNSKLRRN